MVSAKRADGLAVRPRAGKHWAVMGCAWLFFASGEGLSAEAEIRLGLPVACRLGQDCFVQNHFDRDPGPGAQDFRCGGQTYDGHTGTDIRALSLMADIAVLAAAGGTVMAVRDGVADHLLGGPDDPRRRALAGRECGNGVVISHGHGYETQYCHLRQGSVAVAKGQTVARGQVLGRVGSSGVSQFAHLELIVRHKGAALDPFQANTAAPCATGSNGASGLWDQGLDFAYQRGRLIEFGLVSQPITPETAEQGAIAANPVARSSDALVLVARFMHLEAGDVVRLRLTGPEGFAVENTSQPMDRAKAQFVAYAGKKRRTPLWPAGTYQAEITVVRNGQPVLPQTAQFELK